MSTSASTGRAEESRPSAEHTAKGSAVRLSEEISQISSQRIVKLVKALLEPFMRYDCALTVSVFPKVAEKCG